MLLLPYRSTKKIESFPYATIGLIAINVMVYLFTTANFWVVRKDAVELLSFSHANIWSQPWRILTAMFLHGSISHIFFNMMALAVFGPAAEGRVRTGKFLMVYFLSGIIGSFFQDLVSGFGDPHLRNLGASGAIMGVTGMYLFMFPHSKIKLIFTVNIRPRILQWKARWLILLYVFFDLWHGYMMTNDGVGHLVHLGGMAVGWIALMLTDTTFDNAEQTRAEELMEASGGNLSAMLLSELALAYEACPNSADIAIAYCLRSSRDGARRKAVEVMQAREAQIASGPADEIAYVILGLNDYDGNPPGWLILQTALRLIDQDPGLAEALFWRLLRNRPRPSGELLEKALTRLAGLLDAKEKQKPEAAALYYAVHEMFPMSDAAVMARLRLREIGVPSDIQFSLAEGKIVKIEQPKEEPNYRQEEQQKTLDIPIPPVYGSMPATSNA